MSAPNIPTSVSSIRGYVDLGSPVRALFVKWTRSSPTPSPVENYVLEWLDPDDVVVPIARILQSTADAASSALVTYLPTGTPTLDGDETHTILARNFDGDSATVNITPSFFGIPAANTLTAGDLGSATDVAASPGVDGTSATITWNVVTNDVFATHWVIRLTRHGVLVSETLVPFWAQTAALVNLIPGTDYEVQVYARLVSGGATAINSDVFEDSVPFTTDESLAAITGPTALESRLGGLIGASYESSVGVSAWQIIDGPPGVGIAAGVDEYHAALTGSPTAAGIFDATIQALTASGNDLLNLDVRIIISGGESRPFLTWLNDSPTRADVQIDIRTGEVRSYKFDLVNAGVEFVAGEERELHVVFTDRGRVLDDVPTALRVVARQHDAPDAPQLFRLKWDDADTETLSGHECAVLTITPASRTIDTIFASFNGVETAQAGSEAITGIIEFTYTLAGQTNTPAIVKTTIRQPIQ